MAQVTEDLVYNETHAVNGVSNWDRTTASDDSKASFTFSSGKYIIFGLTNLSQTPTSIDSVQVIQESQAEVAAVTAVIQLEMLNSSNTQLNTEFIGISQDSDSINTETLRTTSNGSDAWTENDINTLRIKLTQLAATNPSVTAVCDHFYVRVIYNVADPTAGLIKLNSGLVSLNSGLIKIVG